MSYQPRWFCKDCGESAYLPHNDLFFAPDVCPGCGAQSFGRFRHEQYVSIPAKFVRRPKGRNIFRHVWVDRDGNEIDATRAALREAVVDNE